MMRWAVSWGCSGLLCCCASNTCLSISLTSYTHIQNINHNTQCPATIQWWGPWNVSPPSDVASPNSLGGSKRMALGEQQYFCLGYRFSKHKMISSNLGEWLPGAPWLRLCLYPTSESTTHKSSYAGKAGSLRCTTLACLVCLASRSHAITIHSATELRGGDVILTTGSIHLPSHNEKLTCKKDFSSMEWSSLT